MTESSTPQKPTILILYFSRGGATRQLADAIAEGITSAGGEALQRTVESDSDAASARDLVVSNDDLTDCDGLILGSPTRFGHMASGLQRFWESTSSDWLKGTLINKPGAVFTSTSSLHGGQETTLLSLALPLLHHGMLLTGVPYSQPSLHGKNAGGSPYGASHLQQGALSDNEKLTAKALGQRVCQVASACAAATIDS
ncbi:MAG: flavodoxin domain-containing protein [Pseudomonadota bacterium]